MSDLVDIRCYVTPSYKRRIKKIAFKRNTTVSKLLRDMLYREFGETVGYPSQSIEIKKNEKEKNKNEP